MIAIFIEPKNNLRKFIYKWKSIIKKNYFDTKLTSHPPHSTIYFANLKKEKKIFEELEKITSNFRPFKIKVFKTNIFYNDKFTNGDTIYLNIKKNKQLYSLQLKIAEKLKYFLKTNIKMQNMKLLKDLKLKLSQKKYGFPFVGSHWQPHFTIGSIKNFRTTEDFKKFTKNKIYYENEINCISVWKVLGEKHIRLKIFKFGKKK